MTTLNQEEVDKFSKIADEWWDESGKFKPLHKFNPVRINFIRKKIAQNFSRDEKIFAPFEGLKIADIGCGGGLICEPFAKMKASMTGIDASEKNIKVAQIHAQKSELEINYQQNLVEDFASLSQNQNAFDVVFALEIIEHVNQPELFLQNCAKLVKPDGLLFVATLNRTIKSLLMAKIGAEYILRWLPIGTHDYKKFLKPSEIYEMTNAQGLELQESCGFSYDLLKDAWRENEKDLDVNYIMIFKK